MSTLPGPSRSLVRGPPTADAAGRLGQEEADRRILRALQSALSPTKLTFAFGILTQFYITPQSLPLHNSSRALPPTNASSHRRAERVGGPASRIGITPQSEASQPTEQDGQNLRTSDSESDFSVIFGIRDFREVESNERKEELLDILSPLDPQSDNFKSSTILLCWGEAKNCCVIPAKIPHDADEEQQWQHIQDTWYSHRGEWRRRMLPFFGVKQIDLAKVWMS